MIEIDIKDGFYIKGLPDEIKEKIENDLTYNNPKYAQVKRFSKYSTTRVPKYLEYYQYFRNKGSLYLRVPIGYTKFLSYLDSLEEGVTVDVTDYRKEKIQSDFPKFSLELRDTQEEALKAYLAENVNTLYCSGGIILPTGKGKTILGLALAASLKARTLIIVHTTDLVNGWKKDIEKAFEGKADVGIIKAKSRKIGRHFTIATIQTLNRFSKEELEHLYTAFGFMIQDEMHHCPSNSFSLANNFMPRYRLGLTATPERSDGLAHIMTLYYGNFCYRYKVDSIKKEEDILPVKVLLRDTYLNFNPVCTYEKGEYVFKGDITARKHFTPDYVLGRNEIRIKEIPFYSRPKIAYTDLDSALVNEAGMITRVITDILSEYEQGHSCLVFFTQVSDLLLYQQYLIKNSVPEEDIGLFYGGNRHSEEVKEIAESKRKYITLATYAKAKEGTNVRQWEVCFLVSSINDAKNTEQVLGRIRRTVGEGQEKINPVLVYDYQYNNCYPTYEHGKTRISRYRKLHCTIEGVKKSKMFSRGY